MEVFFFCIGQEPFVIFDLGLEKRQFFDRRTRTGQCVGVLKNCPNLPYLYCRYVKFLPLGSFFWKRHKFYNTWKIQVRICFDGIPESTSSLETSWWGHCAGRI